MPSQAPNSCNFVALDVLPGSTEAPRPGLLLALDAEFVMVQPPEHTFERNMEVLTRNSRCAHVRVSVGVWICCACSWGCAGGSCWREKAVSV